MNGTHYKKIIIKAVGDYHDNWWHGMGGGDCDAISREKKIWSTDQQIFKTSRITHASALQFIF